MCSKGMCEKNELLFTAFPSFLLPPLMKDFLMSLSFPSHVLPFVSLISRSPFYLVLFFSTLSEVYLFSFSTYIISSFRCKKIQMVCKWQDEMEMRAQKVGMEIGNKVKRWTSQERRKIRKIFLFHKDFWARFGLRWL